MKYGVCGELAQYQQRMRPLGRHNRPLLSAGNVGGTGGDPHDIIVVVQGFIIFRVLAEAGVV